MGDIGLFAIEMVWRLLIVCLEFLLDYGVSGVGVVLVVVIGGVGLICSGFLVVMIRFISGLYKRR